MESLDDLQLKSAEQLKGILTSLGATPPEMDYRKPENKQKLVQLVYDIQQPEHDSAEEDESPQQKVNDYPADDEIDNYPHRSVVAPDVLVDGSTDSLRKALSEIDGLSFEIGQDVIKLWKGEKRISTTTKQPHQAIVKTARLFFKR